MGFAGFEGLESEGVDSEGIADCGKTRRQSPGLGTVDAAEWRHAAATGG